MGIRGVWTFFRKHFPVIDPLLLNPGIRVGIDMYSLVYTHRAQLEPMLELLAKWSQHGHSLTCVWDGTAPQEKREIVQERKAGRATADDSKKTLETYLEDHAAELTEADIRNIKSTIKSLSWQSWHMTANIRKQIENTLGPNVEHLQATGEADDQLYKMILQDKTIDVVVTLDSDLFALGAPRIWRLLFTKGQFTVEEIFVRYVCSHWGLTLGNLQDACYLAGWDRFHKQGAAYMPFPTAVNRVKHYKNLQVILEKFASDSIPDEQALKPYRETKADARRLWSEMA